jgi:hypothetical protein
MFRYSLSAFLCLISLNALAQHTNIQIDNVNYPEEPSIAIDPKNPAVLVAGANINKVYVSTDTGNTWTVNTLTSTYGVGGDPMIMVDTAQNFYYFHLRGFSNPQQIDRIVCQRLDSPSGSWSNGSFFGVNGTKMQDKEWAIVDRKTNNIYVGWTQFDVYGSSNPADSSIIRFSRSADQGQTWTTPVRLNTVAGDCIDKSNTVEGAVPCVGPNGEIYVAWAGPLGLLFDKSLDQGQTWMSADKFVDNIGGSGWDYEIPGIFRCNGLPFIACDLSGGPHTGNIYISWSDQSNGPNNTDVWAIRSTDGGNTWQPKVKVNTDAGAHHQFMSSMTIDQVTGYIYVVFYDRRNHADNHTDVYLAVSKDGGQTFVDQKISQTPFEPFSNLFFGDYTHITAHNGIVRPIWTRMDLPFLSVWTAKIDTTMLFTDVSDAPQLFADNASVYPNPFQNTTYIAFKLRAGAPVSLFVTDVFGKKVAVLKDNELLEAGKYTFEFDARTCGVPPGVYYFNLRSRSVNKVQKIILTE